MPGKKRAFIIAALTLMALPASAALHKSPQVYGNVILTVESHFSMTDRNNDGFLDQAEYIAISNRLKSQPEEEAIKDFAAMDMDGDGQLTYDEFYGEMPSGLTV